VDSNRPSSPKYSFPKSNTKLLPVQRINNRLSAQGVVNRSMNDVSSISPDYFSNSKPSTSSSISRVESYFAKGYRSGFYDPIDLNKVFYFIF
jgi:hypothetical protein